jgi:hypothetical protein
MRLKIVGIRFDENLVHFYDCVKDRGGNWVADGFPIRGQSKLLGHAGDKNIPLSYDKALEFLRKGSSGWNCSSARKFGPDLESATEGFPPS